MKSESKKLSVCLIGDPPFERFHSMEIYEEALSKCLVDIGGINVLRHDWPEVGRHHKNRYLAALGGYWKRHLYYPSLLNVPPANIYHILDHSYAHLLAKLPPEKTIVTCHDLMPLMVEGYEKSFGGKLSLASFRHSVSYLKKAQHIIADSKTTKKAMTAVLGIAGEAITVVPLGVDEIFCPGKTATGLGDSEDSECILQVGATAEPYKNTLNILRAMSILTKIEGKRINLLKLGKAYTWEQQKYITSEGIAPHIKNLGFVERTTMPGLYRRSSVLLMPSLYEGFGIPLLEAMASGVPVVTSCRGSIPEVAGDAALYVDPEDPKDIARGVEKVLNDISLRQDLITKGLLRAKGFTWKRTAEETFTVYRRIANIL